MKKLFCFGYFLNCLKPNRLVFQQEAPEGQNATPPKLEDFKENLGQLKEQVQENNSLPYQITLALERFLQKSSPDRFTNLKGDDIDTFEVRQNPVFNYAYEKLDAFFKKHTNSAWPVDLQKEWMNKAVDWMKYRITVNDMVALSNPINNQDVDEFINQLENPDTIPPPVIKGEGIKKSPGTFNNWLYRTRPGKFTEVFRNSSQQYPRNLQKTVTEKGSFAYQRTLAIEKFYIEISKEISSRLFLIKPFLVNYEGDDSTAIDVRQNAVIIHTVEQLCAFFKKYTNPEWPSDLQKEWMNETVNWLVSRLTEHLALPATITNEYIDQFIDGLNDPYTVEVQKYSEIEKPPGTFESWLLENHSDEFVKIFGQLPKSPETT